MRNKIVFFLLIFSLCNVTVNAGSLWNSTSKSPYVRNKPINVGDMITIQIVESSTALQQAQTDLSKKSGVDMDITSSWEKVTNLLNNNNTSSQRNRNQLNISGGDDYNGKGQTTRKSSVKATITVMVTSKISDDLYEIEGNHQLKVNEEVEKIFIKGYIRKQDVTNDNMVLSSQIANAQISVEGNGSVSSKQNPGILTRLFGWLF